MRLARCLLAGAASTESFSATGNRCRAGGVQIGMGHGTSNRVDSDGCRVGGVRVCVHWCVYVCLFSEIWFDRKGDTSI